MSEATPEPTHTVSARLPIGMAAPIGSTWEFAHGQHRYSFALTDEGIWCPTTPLLARPSPWAPGHEHWAQLCEGIEQDLSDEVIEGPEPERECPYFEDTNDHTLDPNLWSKPMSDEAVMSSADAAAAASAAEKILAAIEARFECVDGWAFAYSEYTLGADGLAPDPAKKWRTERVDYRALYYGLVASGGGGGSELGSRSLQVIVEAMPDFVEQAFEAYNADQREGQMRLQDGLPSLVLDPGQERLVWRRKPTVTFRDGRWYCSCRFGFMPKVGVLLPMPGPEE